MCCNIDFLILITDRKCRGVIGVIGVIIEELSKSGGKFINIIYGKGASKANDLLDIIKLNGDENKVVATCFVPKDKIDGIFDMLIKNFNFDKPNTGIAFTIPVEELSL